MPANRSVDADTKRQGAGHLHVERPLPFASTGCYWPIVRIRKDGASACNQPKAVSHLSPHLRDLKKENAFAAACRYQANRCTTDFSRLQR